MLRKFQPGDRVQAHNTSALIEQVRGRQGVVTKYQSSMVYVRLDNVKNPSNDGWSFQEQYLDFIEPEPTDEEIRALFGLKPKPDTQTDDALKEAAEILNEKPKYWTNKQRAVFQRLLSESEQLRAMLLIKEDN